MPPKDTTPKPPAADASAAVASAAPETVTPVASMQDAATLHAANAALRADLEASAKLLAEASANVGNVALSVTFTPVDAEKAKTDSGLMLARAAITGCFGQLPIVISQIALQLKRDQTIAVYMPGLAYSRVIGPAKIMLPEPVEVNGRLVYAVDDKLGSAAVRKLEQSIRDAWSAVAARVDRFGVAVPLAL